MSYGDVMRVLGVSEVLCRCADGAIAPWLWTYVAPAEWSCFPPALVPVWSEGIDYIGYWKHWFVERTPSIVRYLVEATGAYEIARSPDQLFAVLLMEGLVFTDGQQVAGEVDLGVFAENVGFTGLPLLQQLYQHHGEDPQTYTELELFAHTTPLQYVTDPRAQYTGEFPVGTPDPTSARWQQCCSCEIPYEARAELSEVPGLPLWLYAHTPKPPLFDACLATGELGNAWLTLNSSGWTIAEAKQALAALSARAGDAAFGQLAEEWIAMADEAAGGY